MNAYVTKALSEGKVNVTWINPHPEYTAAVQVFVARLLEPVDDEGTTQFVSQLEEFLDSVRLHGAFNSLAQVVLKITSPGVPDFYQGSALWDLSLVDPDNRRPVDYELRSGVLHTIESSSKLQSIRNFIHDLASGSIKLLTTHLALATRKANLSAFVSGAYIPLEVSDNEHLFAYMRGQDIIVVIPRFTYTLVQGHPIWPVGSCWKERSIYLPASASGSWVNTISGEKCEGVDGQLRVSKIFAEMPVAILARQW